MVFDCGRLVLFFITAKRPTPVGLSYFGMLTCKILLFLFDHLRIPTATAEIVSLHRYSILKSLPSNQNKPFTQSLSNNYLLTFTTTKKKIYE